MPSFITIGKIVLFEPLLFCLILISAISCIIFGIYTYRTKRKDNDKDFKNLKTLLFLFLGLSLIFGALTHGFFPNFVSGRLILWKVSLVLFGIAAFFNFVIAGQYITTQNKKLVYVLASLEFLIYQFYITVIDTDFKIALVNYFISGVFFYLVSFRIKNLTNQKNIGTIAFLLLCASFLVYIFKINLQNTAFNYIILHHLLFFASNIFMFKFYSSLRIKRNI